MFILTLPQTQKNTIARRRIQILNTVNLFAKAKPGYVHQETEGVLNQKPRILVKFAANNSHFSSF